MTQLFMHELRNALSGGKFAVACILILASFLVSLMMMSQEYDRRLDNFYESRGLTGEDLFWNKVFYYETEDGSTRNNSDTLTFPMGVVKEPSPLLFFTRGMDRQMRQSVELLATFPIVDINIKPDQEVNLMRVLFSAPDILFILKVLVSLLAILYAFDLVVAERERGTLKLLSTCGASRAQIFWGKFFGGLTGLWVAYTLSFLVYAIALEFLTPVSLSGEVATRVVLLFAAGLLHIAVFFAIGAAVSVFFRTTPPALIVSLFIWLLLVFALPGLSSLLAQQFAPVDSDQTVNRMKLEKAQQMEADYAASNPDDTNVSGTAGYGQRHDAIRNQINDALKQIDDEHQRRKEYQATLTTGLARISPIGSLTYLYSALSWNGLEDVQLYNADLIMMRNKLNDTLTGILTNQEFMQLYMEGKWDIPDELREDAVNVFDMPMEQGFRNLQLGETISASFLDLALMFAWALVAAVLAFIRFLSYDVR